MHDCYNAIFYGKDRIIDLTQTENIILDILLNPKRHLITFGELCDRLYKADEDTSFKRCIRRQICSLNEKLKNEIKILNVRGYGYVIL